MFCIWSAHLIHFQTFSRGFCGESELCNWFICQVASQSGTWKMLDVFVILYKLNMQYVKADL